MSFVCSQHKFQWRNKDKTEIKLGLCNSGILHLVVGLKSLPGFIITSLRSQIDTERGKDNNVVITFDHHLISLKMLRYCL